jgi:hypothetical protein
VQQPDVIRQALAIRTPSGDRLFDCVQATFNLLEQSAGGGESDTLSTVLLKTLLADVLLG